MSEGERRVLLVGGGHAHVAVLADWIRRGAPGGVRTALVTPHARLRYSGMVPGWLAGEHPQQAGMVDLAALARRAGVELLLDRCTGIDPAARTIRTGSGRALGFDLASLDTGGVGQGAALLGDDPRLIEVRPIDRFVERLAAWRRQRAGLASRIVVVGGGAGGVELAFAARNMAEAATPPAVALVTGSDGLLPGFSGAVRRRILRELERQEIAVVAGNASFADGRLMAGPRSLEPADLVIAALGSGAPGWPKDSGLACDERGFVMVDRYQRSLSHQWVFAVGDVAVRTDRAVARSGVHAVFAGPVLAANLRAALVGRNPVRSYRPRGRNLYLMTTGNGSAIASYGPLAAQGRWVLALKHWIDKRWIAKYASLAGRQ